MNLLRFPQTYLLLVGIGLGYGCLIMWQGFRPVVLLGGGIVSLGTLASWVWQLRPVSDTDNLLHPPTFLAQLTPLERKLPKSSESTWTPIKTLALQSQEFAGRIAQEEPVLTADLLETLHTVLDLSAQVVDALQVIEQMKTPAYRKLAQEGLQASCNRIQETHDQLQQLQDQIALWTLEKRVESTAAIPDRLRLLIADNKTTLRSPPQIS